MLLLKKYAYQDKESLQTKINGMFKSRDGFMSFYGDFVEEWKTKPFSQWDENEVSVLFPVFEIDYEDITETISNSISYTEIKEE